MDLSIVIVNWNTGELLCQCLRSIFNSETKYSFEVLVVDNASLDRSIQTAVEQFPEVDFILNPVNSGFAAANNAASKKAAGKFILFLNPDTIVSKYNIEKSVSQMKNTDDNIGILGCRIYHANNEIQRSIQDFPTLTRAFLVGAQLNLFLYDSIMAKNIGRKLSKFFPRNLSRLEKDKYFKKNNVDSVLGAYFLVKKNLFVEMGGFDERFFMFGEEMDFAFRAKKAGFLVRFYPGTSIVHFSGGSINQVKWEMYLELMRSHIYFCEKHRSKIYSYLYKICWLSGFLVRISLNPKLVFSRVEFSHYSRSNFFIRFIRFFFNI